MEKQQTSPQEGVKPYRVEYHKSPLHRYIPADGQWLGLNGYGKIILNFFNDSPPLPKTMILEAKNDGYSFTDKEPEITYHDSESVRQFEVSVLISLFAAKQLKEQLGSFIKMAEDQAAHRPQ